MLMLVCVKTFYSVLVAAFVFVSLAYNKASLSRPKEAESRVSVVGLELLACLAKHYFILFLGTLRES